MLLKIRNTDFELYRYFRVASSVFINWLKSALYKANIHKLDDSVQLHKLPKSALHSEVRYQFCYSFDPL
jgi:hypothetical protein